MKTLNEICAALRQGDEDMKAHRGFQVAEFKAFNIKAVEVILDGSIN